jgi:hypothetical protein
MENADAIALGKEIVDSVNTESEIFNNENQWHKFVKGLIIRPGDENTVMWRVPIGEGQLKLRLYYHETEYQDAGKQKFHDFPIVLPGPDEQKSFTNYSSDRSSTPQRLDRLVEQENELDSEQTDHLTFIQGGVGLYTKINIPYIEHLKRLGIAGGVLKAELIMYPKNDSFDDELYPLPDENTNIVLYNTNEDNQFRSSLPGPNSSTLAFKVNRNLQNKDETYYSTDLTSYVNNVLVAGKEYEDAILIGIKRETVGNTYDRLIIEDDPNSDYRIKLKVTYVIQR